MFLAYILSKIRARRGYHRTLRTFTQFSDHELEDIGISRNEIDAIARAAAQAINIPRLRHG